MQFAKAQAIKLYKRGVTVTDAFLFRQMEQLPLDNCRSKGRTNSSNEHGTTNGPFGPSSLILVQHQNRVGDEGSLSTFISGKPTTRKPPSPDKVTEARSPLYGIGPTSAILALLRPAAFPVPIQHHERLRNEQPDPIGRDHIPFAARVHAVRQQLRIGMAEQIETAL